ncbi:quinone oxidoreductase [Cohnella kolymensis]|uniref:Quinone oxidoreductase n=1 Tax=Cohnella kolymensis TaxID=1590652 RepID=A0ABR5AA45_9BACL|nr:oxidoreductase [Cohnella kolymensis]KIL37563.1 quinone oxidoreductase [Cohnella kolymensis]
MDSFKALVVDKVNGEVVASSRVMKVEDLPEGQLLIKVSYSSINYKDALAFSTNGNIVKNYPFVPGIDLAGVVVSSSDDQFQEGDEIVVTGYKLGVSHFGGFSSFARVPAEWAVKLPDNLTLKEAMIFGTAGFTAALSVLELQEAGVLPESGPVLVTGATGGVGSVALAILARLGYEAVASTGKAEMTDYLLGLGAKRVISRDELLSGEIPALGKQLWAGAVDCVGGKTLSSILPTLQYGGAVAASGLTGGTELAATVFPFILRGIRLIGIDSVFAGMNRRKQVWQLLSSDYKPAMLDRMSEEIELEQVPEYVPVILKGQSRGRVVVKL